MSSIVEGLCRSICEERFAFSASACMKPILVIGRFTLKSELSCNAAFEQTGQHGRRVWP